MNNKYNPALFWFAVLNAVATFLLIGLGGLVTSHEAGMSVPDWPTSYGYNMFPFPIKDWVGGIFYEHSHRLLASAVGLLTTILAVWLWLKDPRKWMHWLGIAAFLLVIVQGILGGLRVRLNMDSLGIPHGAIAQIFLVLTCAIALFTSRWWRNSADGKTNCRSARPAQPCALRHDFDFHPADHRRDHAASARRPVHLGFSAGATEKSGRTPARRHCRLQRASSARHHWAIPSPRFKWFCRWFIASSPSRFFSASRRRRFWRGKNWAARRADEVRLVLAGVDRRANRPGRGDHLVEQGGGRGHAARHGRRAGAADRRAVVARGRAADATGRIMVLPIQFKECPY